MICTWTVSVSSGFTNFAICGSDDMQCRSTFTYTNDLYMNSSVSFGFANFAICGSDDMYNNLSVLHTLSIILLKLMGVF